jgi:hypothetical protein
LPRNADERRTRLICHAGNTLHRYDLTTFSLPLGGVPRAMPAIERYFGDAAHGTLRACFTSDIGVLNEILILRDFASDAARIEERERMVRDGNAFGIGEHVNAMTTATFTMFPFLPPLLQGAHGPYFEVRTYTLRPSGLAPVIAAWEAAVPGRIPRSPLAAAMYAIEGDTPRFMHVWPYASLDARFSIRANAVADGVWPPKGGADHILTMRNAIYLAAPFSPLK